VAISNYITAASHAVNAAQASSAVGQISDPKSPGGLANRGSESLGGGGLSSVTQSRLNRPPPGFEEEKAKIKLADGLLDGLISGSAVSGNTSGDKSSSGQTLALSSAVSGQTQSLSAMTKGGGSVVSGGGKTVGSTSQSSLAYMLQQGTGGRPHGTQAPHNSQATLAPGQSMANFGVGQSTVAMSYPGSSLSPAGCMSPAGYSSPGGNMGSMRASGGFGNFGQSHGMSSPRHAHHGAQPKLPSAEQIQSDINMLVQNLNSLTQVAASQFAPPGINDSIKQMNETLQHQIQLLNYVVQNNAGMHALGKGRDHRRLEGAAPVPGRNSRTNYDPRNPAKHRTASRDGINAKKTENAQAGGPLSLAELIGGGNTANNGQQNANSATSMEKTSTDHTASTSAGKAISLASMVGNEANVAGTSAPSKGATNNAGLVSSPKSAEVFSQIEFQSYHQGIQNPASYLESVDPYYGRNTYNTIFL